MNCTDDILTTLNFKVSCLLKFLYIVKWAFNSVVHNKLARPLSISKLHVSFCLVNARDC